MEKNSQVELLAPAGNYDCFLAAVNAGADAVYLAGDKFGARAYAGNFSDEEIIRAIWHAHLFGVKIYLTVNTLIKERELSSVCAFLEPFYEAGLDGVIVQDLGAARLIRDNFPGLKLCASTQMTVTQAGFAGRLSAFGFSRVIPARELNLEEIRALCLGLKDTGMEVEVFIHGAMCYSVSGRCLFSSMLGDRSANRGRCAGPCRMEYNGKYLLSLKDMVTIDHIPALIDAGVKSFKIEGRMKPPEYVAGIVSVYRKAIDAVIFGKVENKAESGKSRSKGVSSEGLSQADRQLLNSVYIRTNPGPGYLTGKTGPDMISLDSPAYTKSDEAVLERIRREIIAVDKKIPVKLSVRMKKGEEAFLKISVLSEDERDAGVELEVHDRTGLEIPGPCGDERGVGIELYGPIVQQSQKAPLTIDKIQKALCAMGDTVFEVSGCKIEADEDIFLPVGQIKELRREAIHALEEKIICSNTR